MSIQFNAYADVALIGHAWWEFNVEDSELSSLPNDLQQYVNCEMGFYPDSRVDLIHRETDGSVEYEQHMREHDIDISKSWDISFDDLISSLEYVDSIYNDAPDYNLFHNNCTDQLYEVADAANLDIEVAEQIDILGAPWSFIISHPSELNIC